MSHWSQEAVFYHIYPLGLCGAPVRNDFSAPPVPRLEMLYGWLDHISGMGFNALYLGPLFESSSHGYDTADYFHVDRRLGTNSTLAGLVSEMHRRGIRVILDGVFNHVGRDFWAFRDVRANGPASRFAGWFAGLRFEGRNRHGDPFTYETWNGHESLWWTWAFSRSWLPSAGASRRTSG
jgi:glycosidase